jgi:hypothetical protein
VIALPVPSSLVRSISILTSFSTLLTGTPEGQKSTGQKLGDATRSGGDNASNQGEGVMKQAQDTLSSAGQSISDTLSGATQNKK